MACKALQANLHHAKGPSGTLLCRFTQENIGLVLIQEPWTRDGRICGLSTKLGKLIYDRNTEKPRAAILANSDLDWFPINQFISRDLVAISVTYKAEDRKVDVICASAYFPGDDEEAPPREVEDLIKHCHRENLPYIIGCDANSHHTIWGSSDINSRGESLLEFLLKEKVQILNRGNKPTFKNAIREEVLDLTLCSNNIADVICNWHVSNEDSGSDHMHIRFDIDLASEASERKSNKRHVNWEKFSNTIGIKSSQLPNSIESPEDIELAATLITDILVSTYEECSEITVNKVRKVPWWNKELAAMRKTVRRAFNKANSLDLWTEYRAERNRYNKMIKTAKNNSWRSFCGDLEDIPETARIHKLLTKDGSNGVGTLLRTDGTHTGNREQTLEELLRVHFPGSTTYVNTNTFEAPTYSDRKRAKSLAGKIFHAKKVEWTIMSFQPYKAAGPDQIFPALLQKALTHIAETLGCLFKASYIWGYIPTSWRKVNVVFLPKPGKPSYLAKSYRPVSLTSFLLKSMEKMINLHIREDMETSYPLHHTQYAYRKGRSTEMALHEISQDIEKTLRCKDFSLGAFLDIEGAFDNTGHDSIKRAMARRNIDKATTVWVESMLKDRITSSTLGADTLTITSSKGCPQGGVLSPLLWSLVVDELLETLEESGHKAIGYADDIVVYSTGKYEDTVRNRMTDAILGILRWCEKVGLRANPSKTTLVPFTNRKKISQEPIIINNLPIPYSREVKYLGVILDQRMTWNAHTENLYTKGLKALWTCSSYCGRAWGAPPELMLKMYKSVVRPILTYAAWIWWKKAEQITTQKKLNKLQRLACLLITGAMKTCPTAAMEVIIGITPLHIHIEAEAARGALKHVTLNGEVDTRGHMSILNKIPNWEYLAHGTDMTLKAYDFDKPFSTTILEREGWSIEKLHIGKNDSVWYTDGSKTEEGTGFGVYGPRTRISCSLGKTSTIFQAELEAVRNCITLLRDRKPLGQRFTIMSDSQAVIKALTNVESDSKLVRECLSAIKQLTVRNKLRICWVPGHIGVEGNEIADELARKGASTRFIGPEPVCGLNWSAALGTIGSWVKSECARHWREQPGMKQAKTLIKPQIRPDFIYLKKGELRQVVGYLTGHNTLRYHLNKMGVCEDTTCRLCSQDTESSTHILCNCGGLDKNRYEIFGKVTLDVYDVQESTVSNLCELVKVAARKLAEFDSSL